MPSDLPEIPASLSAVSLISISNIEEIHEEWVNDTISYLDKLSSDSDREAGQKHQLRNSEQAKLKHIASQAGKISNLVRVLYRLAKSTADTRNLCKDMIASINTQLTMNNVQPNQPQLQTPTPHSTPPNHQPNDPINNNGHRSYAQTLQNTVSHADKPIIPSSEITLIPKTSYEADIKKVTQKLKQHQVESARKSKAGNIVIKCANADKIKSVENALKSQDFVTVKTMEKNLPKMTILAVESEADADFTSAAAAFREDILCRNPFLKTLHDTGKVFSVLFMRKNNGLVNFTVKLDPEIRHAILKNSSKVFVGLKSCRVIDSFPFKVCFNCQMTGDHLSNECPIRDRTLCRYCSENHKTKDCGSKNDTSKHICVNCHNSKINRIKSNANTHFSNHVNCPLVTAIVDNIKANTLYSKNE